MLDDLALFAASNLVHEFSVVSFQFQANAAAFRTKVRVILTNGWLLDCWERLEPEIRRYSYHVLDGDRLIVRWDNAPHHSHLENFPYHQHIGGTILTSEEMDVAKVLSQLEGIM